MNNEIRVLILEDTPADAELAERELRRAGVVFTPKRVDTKDAFARELEDFKPDIILADYKLPAFDGRSAVQLVRQTHPEIPVIMVTGTLGDEAAVELLKAGARDYVLKDGLKRLGPAVRRALSEEQGIRARKQAERAVKDSEKRFRSLIEHASDLVTVVDARGKIVYISPAVKRLGGYEVDEVLGTHYLDYAHPEDRPAAVASLAELLRGPGNLHVSEFRFRAKDGAWVTLESIARNALDDPVINGIVINSRDITERKLAQSELEFNNSVLLTQQETSLDAILLVDKNRNILSYNRHFVDLWGLPEDMLKAGLNEPILKRVITQAEDPDAYLARVLYLYEHPEEKSRDEIRLKDGRTIDRYSASVIGAGGQDFGRVWYFRDITERKRAEENIARLNRLYATVSGINTAIVHSTNAAELFDQVCEIAVEHGRFCMAWIGMVDRADQMVRPVAQRGLAPEDMVMIRDSIGRIAEGRGRTATAIREGRPIYTNNYDAERASTAWHAEAIKRSIRGSATLPIKQGGQIVGVLKLYVRERDFFDAEQLALLEEMRTDISFALDRFDAVAKQAQAEAALHESEVRFRALIENASDITGVVSQDGVISYTSPSIKTIAGYDPDELVGSHMVQVIHPDDVQAATGTLSESIRVPEEAHRVELRIRMKDGSWRVFEVLVRNQLGQAAIGGVIVNMRDVTERKRAEDALAESEANLKAIFDAAADGILLAEAETRRFRAANASICRMLGYSLGELLDLGVPDIHPVEALPHVIRQFELQANAEIGVISDLPVKRKDGSVFFADVNSTPVTLDGKACLLGIFRDVTERKESEQALRDSEEKLRTISSSAQDAIVMADNDGRVEFWNPSAEKLFGYSAEEAAGNPLCDLIVPERLCEKHQSGFEKFRITGQGPVIGKTMELPCLRKDGTEFIAEHSISAVQLKGRWHAVAMVRDITERKLAAQERERQEKRLARGLEQTVLAIATTVEMRDPYTAGHQRRVTDLAVAIARELGLSDEQIHGLHLAGVVHDLGKIQVPAEILSKPGKLTDIEFSLIKIHPQAGYDILKDVEFPWPIAQIVLQHHERLDGSGYPNGLKGDAIIFEARILAVADVIEAMSSHRPYRPGLGIEKALAEIERGRGIAYEPSVVDACVRLFREKQFSWV